MIVHLLRTVAVLALVYGSQQKEAPTSLISKLKTDKRYIEGSLNPKNIYAIDVERVATSREDETSKCVAQQK